MGLTRPAVGLIALALLWSLTGCNSFEREWKRESRYPTAYGTIAGVWKGKWVSDKTGHEGELRAVIKRIDHDTFHVWYDSVYEKTLHFKYDLFMDVRLEGTTAYFKGRADLGKLAGGVYTYEGKADTYNFFSTYRSKYDYGTFEMTRP